MVDSLKELLEKHIAEIIRSLITDASLREMIHYSMYPGGKRLRPLMALSVGGEEAVDIAVAIECLHTYSLIHDDLPCMDNDDMRRNKPSLHKAFDEASAVLTGDALLTLAFQLIADSSLPANTRLACSSSLAKAAGVNAMIAGQLADIKAKKIPLSYSNYKKMIEGKTAALFTASLECGAIVAELPREKTENLKHFGKIFGFLYQMHDDLEDKDDVSAADILGKERTTDLLSSLMKEAADLLKELSLPCDFLSKLLFTLETKIEKKKALAIAPF